MASQWNGEAALHQIEAAGWEAIQRATVYFWSKVQEALNTPNPPPYANPSAPGHPPHKRTGFGAANVVYEFDALHLTARVGVTANAKYLAMWEVGIRGVQRPWLLAALEQNLAAIKRLAEGNR